MNKDLFLRSVVLCLTPQVERDMDFIPHREWNDLRIEYRLYKGGQVDYNLMYGCGCTEEEIYAAALKNTKRLMPVILQSLNSFVESKTKVSNDDAYNDMSTVWIVRTESGRDGACSILYPEVLEDVGKKIGSNFYILPSSRHEVLCISVDKITANAAVNMVRDVNKAEVSKDDFLSDNIYFYDRKTKETIVIK